MWPFSRRPPPVRTQEAHRAIERASAALEVAETDLATMRRLAAESKRQREANHFGPLMYEAMKGRPT